MLYLSQHQRDFCVSLVTQQQRLETKIKLSLFYLSLPLQFLLFYCLGSRGVSMETIIIYILLMWNMQADFIYTISLKSSSP